MSQHTIASSNAGQVETNTLDEVYRRLAQVHATLAEADGVDDVLHGRTLDWLMDILELIDAVPSSAHGAPMARPDANATIDSIDRSPASSP